VAASASLIRIRFFSAIAERLNRQELEIPYTQGLTVGDLRAILTDRYPEAQDLWKISAFAVDEVYASDDDPIAPEALVAVIPPVSGG